MCGTLLSRDKFFIVLYRGKDFLPKALATALAARYERAQMMGDREERARLLSLPQRPKPTPTPPPQQDPGSDGDTENRPPAEDEEEEDKDNDSAGAEGQTQAEGERMQGSGEQQEEEEEESGAGRAVKAAEEEQQQQKEEEEGLDDITRGLGPKVASWDKPGLVPVDGDALCERPVAEYKQPFRLLPYGISGRLTNTEMTTLRRLARKMAAHFVIGPRPPAAGTVEEVEALRAKWQTWNTTVDGKARRAALEAARKLHEVRRIENKLNLVSGSACPGQAPAISEPCLALRARHTGPAAIFNGPLEAVAAELGFAGDALMQGFVVSIFLVGAFLGSIGGGTLADLVGRRRSFQLDAIPLVLGSVLSCVLELGLGWGLGGAGKRGVFDGVVENMHLHWKHRELVKVIAKENSLARASLIARQLEYESGGILSLELHILSLEDHMQELRAGLDKETAARVGKAGRVGELEIPNELQVADDEDAVLLSQMEDVQRAREERQAYKKRMQAERAALKRSALLGPVYRAPPLRAKERVLLRKEALLLSKAASFQVGRNNVVSGLARAIRVYFMNNALVKVGIKGRAHGTPVDEICRQLEEATGGVFVSREPAKIILYRGWPESQSTPGEIKVDEMPAVLAAAMLEEDEDPEEDDEDLAMYEELRSSLIGSKSEEEEEVEEEGEDDGDGEGWEDEYDDSDVVDVDADSALDDDKEEEEDSDYDEDEDGEGEWESGSESEGGGLISSNFSEGIMDKVERARMTTRTMRTATRVVRRILLTSEF
eukprot:jgi/Mesen1/3916/ME000208S02926